MYEIKKKKILLVEDDLLLASAEEKVLCGLGYNVIIANSGDKAIHVAENDPDINLILMDIKPGDGTDGIDAARQILHDKELPLIFYSSLPDEDISERISSIPHCGFVIKNSGSFILKSAIETALRIFKEKNETKRQIEDTLREKESKYLAIFLASPDSISVTSLDGTYVDINDSYVRLTGFSREDVIGKKVSEIGIWGDKKELSKLMKEIKKTGYIENMEALFRCKDGSLKKSFISSQIITLNTIPHILSITRDFTERIRAEEALRLSEANFAEAQALAHLGSWELYPAENRTSWTDEMFRIFGIDPAESPPANVFEYMKYIHPQDRDRVFEYQSGLVFENKPFKNEFRIIRPDGTVRWIESRGKPEYSNNGIISRIVGTALDITDRKNAEEALRLSEARLAAAQARVNLGSWEFIMEDNSLIWSDEMYRIFRIDPFKETVSSFEDIMPKIHPQDRMRVQQEEIQAFKEKKFLKIEYRIILPDGSERWVESQSGPVLDHDENIERIVGTVLDITDWKRADEALRISESRLSAAQARAHLGSWEVTIADNKSVWSDEMYRIFGIDATTKTPVNLTEFSKYIHPQDRIWAAEKESAAVNENRPFKNQYRIIRPDGTERWIESQGEPTYDNGRLTHVTGTALDITDWKVASEALRVSEANLADAQARAHLGSWSFDYKQMTSEWSDEMYKLFGITPNEGPLVGIEELVSAIYPEDIEKVRNNEIRISRGKESFKTEYRIIRRSDKTVRWMESSFDPVIDQDGNVTGIVGTALDITDRKLAEEALKESEEKFRSIAENISDAIFITDEKGMITYMSDSTSDIFGYTPEEMAGHFFGEYLNDNEIENVYPVFQKSIQDGFSPRNIEFTAKRKDHSLFFAELKSSIIIKNGKVTGTLGLIRDISERKDAEEKIKNLLKEKETLLKEVHHRIKNNMSVMISLLSLQADNLKDSHVVSALMDARARMQSMGVLYDKLYRTENFTHMSLKMYMTPLLDEIMGMFPRKIPITIEKDIEDFDLSYRQLSSIGIMTTEIITNTLKHAFKDRDRGVMKVSSSIKNNHVTIIFQDNGIGIPKSIDLEHTTGFGLQLIKLLTLQIKGNIKIERESGTKFILEFDI